MKEIKEILSDLSFFSDLPEEMLEFIAGCGQNMHFAPEEYLGRENESADYLFVIRKGNIAVQLTHPTKGAYTIRSLHDGEVAGFSWIIPPYRMQFDLKACEHTSVVALDGKCVRKKCTEDHHLGFLLMRSSALVMHKRLEDTRIQLMDLYSGRI